MNPYFAAQRQFLRDLAQFGNDVTLRWKTTANVSLDETTQAVLGDVTEQTETVKGFFQMMDPKTQLRFFNQVTSGIAHLDLDPSVTIEGRNGLVFQVDGQLWVQAEVGEEVVRYFDTFHANVRYCRTLILRRQT